MMKTRITLTLAGFILFGASVWHPFHFDDVLITTDSNVTSPARWFHFLNPLHLRQVTFFSFYLNHLIGGLNPAGYHLVNVGLHVLNAVLFFTFLSRFVAPWIATAASVVFLVHPIQTEPVLYIYQRSALLACTFSLLALIAIAMGRPLFAVLGFLLAFGSKESAVGVPIAVACLAAMSGITSVKMRAWFRWALLALAGTCAGAALFLLAGANEHTVGLLASARPMRYFVAETRVAFTYLRLLVWPYPQSVEYDFANAGSVMSLLMLTAVVACAWRFRDRLWGAMALAFFILLAPTSSIVPNADPAFEHRLYLPMLAFSVLAASVLSGLPQRTWVTAALVSVLAFMTVQRERVWASEVTLWEDAVQHAPNKPRVWFNLGGAYLSVESDKARAAYRHALQLEPNWPEALYDLGLIEQNRGNFAAALSYYDQALAQDPQYWPALNNIGNTLFAMGDRSRCLEYFERTLRLNPDYWPAQYNLAIVHLMNGRYTDAVPKLRIVLDWRPDFRDARYLLATSLTQSGDRDAAAKEWLKLGVMNAAESRHTPTMILAPSRP